MTYIGIDPGQKGAWAVIDGTSITVRPWNEEEFVETMQMLHHYGGPCRTALEHVSAMPGQGVTSMFTFGTGFGFLQGVLRACSIPYSWVIIVSLTLTTVKRVQHEIKLKNEEPCICSALAAVGSIRTDERVLNRCNSNPSFCARRTE